MGEDHLSERLRKSILLYSILSGLLLAVIVAAVSLVPSYQSLRLQRENDLLSVLHVRGGRVEVFLWEARDIARLIASRTSIVENLELVAGDPSRTATAADEIQESLLAAVNAAPDVAAAYCFDPTGRPLTHVGPLLPRGAQQWLQEQIARGEGFRPVPAQGEYHLLYLVEIRDRSDRLLGVLVIEYELDTLRSRLMRLPDVGLHEDTVIGFKDGDNVSVFMELLGRDRASREAPPEPRVFEALRHTIANESGLIVWDAGPHESELLAYRPIEGADWGIVLRQTESTLLADVNDQLRSVGGVVLLLIAVISIGMYKLLRPLAGKLVLHSRELEDQIESQTAVLTAERQRLLEANEALQRQKNQLQSANEDLEAFSRTVAHDLRSPLVAVQGYADLLLTTDRIRSDPDSFRMLERVAIKSRMMADQIKSLLRYARAGKASPNRKTVDLSGVAEAVGRDLASEHPDRQVELNVQPGLTVSADEPLLQIVMENLLGNAWKYTSRTDHAVVDVGAEQRDGQQVFFVRDNGTGFDMMFAEKLFQPFQRLHSDAEFAGTGIGLSTVRRIVLQHGGRIWAEGRLGKGATFFFTLPAANA